MSEFYSVREAAAIAELSPKRIRTALEKKAITSSVRRKAGKAVRHQFSVRDLFFIKLLAEFPFALGRTDKQALRQLLVCGDTASRQWRLQGPDVVFSSGDVTVFVECKSIRTRLAGNIATYRWGKRQVLSSPDIMSGEPVFRGTRVPLNHVAALLRKSVDEREIREDFPNLTDRHLAFAKLYSRLTPPPGRPRRPVQIRRERNVA